MPFFRQFWRHGHGTKPRCTLRVGMFGVCIALAVACPAFAQEQGLQDLLEAVQKGGGDFGKLRDSGLPASNETPLPTFSNTPRLSSENNSPPITAGLPVVQSPLEEDYGARLTQTAPLTTEQTREKFSFPLLQFGYDALWMSPTINGNTTQNTAVHGRYLLGAGDTVQVSYRGDTSRTMEVAINRAGQLIIPDMPPLNATGLTLEQLQENVTREAESTLTGTKIFLALAKTRPMTVLVSGHVVVPGSRTVSGFATVLDALVAAGGVQKTGSLRQIRLIRDGQQRTIDLYGFLQGDALTQDYQLRDGDRLIVPPVGQTVAISGDVQQPAIYELPLEATQISLKSALRYAGGTLRPRGNKLLLQHIDVSGNERLSEASNHLHSGDILLVQRSVNSTVGMVKLRGHVFSPVQRALAAAPTVRNLIGGRAALPDDAYLLLALIERRAAASGMTEWVPVNLLEALSGKSDVPLRDNDTLIIFSQNDVRYLWSADIRAILAGKLPASMVLARGNQGAPVNPTPSLGEDASGLPSGSRSRAEQQRALSARQQGAVLKALDGNQKTDTPKEEARLLARGSTPDVLIEGQTCAGMELLLHILKTQGSERFLNVNRAFAGLARGGQEVETYQPCPAIFAQHPDTLPVLMDQIVAVGGEVQIPGAYPVASSASLESLLAAAGGLTRSADASDISLSQFSSDGAGAITDSRITIDFTKPQTTAVIRAGNFLTINRKASSVLGGVVELSGQFKRPGIYDIRENERLSSVIARAGGYTETAYPYGAFFTRSSIRAQEKQNYERLAQQLEKNLINVASELQGRDNAGTVLAGINKLTENLRSTEALGRMVIEGDPATLAARPDQDILLESGDKIFVPKRPSFVMVSGEVLNPGAQQYSPDADAAAYVKAAGGLQRAADDNRIFVLLPNGEAKPVSLSAWNYRKMMVPPGSAVVVPTDPVPFTLMNAFKDVGTVFNQFALTAASLAVIARD